MQVRIPDESHEILGGKLATTGLIADLHCRLGDTLHPALAEVLQKYDLIIDVGDQCEMMPWGIDAWRSELGRLTIESIASSVKEMVVISKNHWGLSRWAKELYAPYPHVTVVDEYELTGDDGRTYWFRHGSEYSEWRTIQPMANLVTLAMCHNPLVRRLWYEWCAMWGYMPKGLLDAPPRMIEMGAEIICTGKYQNLFGMAGIRGVWKKALRAAEKRGNTTHYIAHTHRFIRLRGENGSELINMKPREIMHL